MGKSKKDGVKHLGKCSSFLAAAVGLLCAAAALIEAILFAEYYPGDAFSADFPDCIGDFGDLNPCISPLINLKWTLVALSVATFVISLGAVLLPFRSCLPSFMTLMEPVLEKAPFGFFMVLGFMVLGMAGVIGFAAGICCFITAVIFGVLCFF